MVNAIFALRRDELATRTSRRQPSKRITSAVSACAPFGLPRRLRTLLTRANTSRRWYAWGCNRLRRPPADNSIKDIVATRQHDDFDVRLRTDLAGKRQAILARHDYVEENTSLLSLRTQRHRPARRSPLTFLVEMAAEHLTDSLVVISDQDMRRVIPLPGHVNLGRRLVTHCYKTAPVSHGDDTPVT